MYKVLIADDEVEMVDVLKNALEREGFSVVSAYDGQQAKEQIIQHRPDMILLDIKMPRLDGWEFLRWLREEEKLDTPTIIISAHDHMENVKKSYSFAADYFIAKPIRIKDLIKGIYTVKYLKENTQEPDEPS